MIVLYLCTWFFKKNTCLRDPPQYDNYNVSIKHSLIPLRTLNDLPGLILHTLFSVTIWPSITYTIFPRQHFEPSLYYSFVSYVLSERKCVILSGQWQLINHFYQVSAWQFGAFGHDRSILGINIQVCLHEY